MESTSFGNRAFFNAELFFERTYI